MAAGSSGSGQACQGGVKAVVSSVCLVVFVLSGRLHAGLLVLNPSICSSKFMVGLAVFEEEAGSLCNWRL